MRREAKMEAEVCWRVAKRFSKVTFIQTALIIHKLTAVCSMTFFALQSQIWNMQI